MGRAFDDTKTLASRLNEIYRDHTITEIIEGGASGADTLAREFGAETGIPVRTVPADWARHGPRRRAHPEIGRCLEEGKPDIGDLIDAVLPWAPNRPVREAGISG